MTLKGTVLIRHYRITHRIRRSRCHQRMHFAMGHILMLRKPSGAVLAGEEITNLGAALLCLSLKAQQRLAASQKPRMPKRDNTDALLPKHIEISCSL